MDKSVNKIINKILQSKEEFLNKCLEDIKDNCSSDKFNVIMEHINKIDKSYNLPAELEVYRPLISDILKCLYIQQTKISLSDNMLVQTIDIATKLKNEKVNLNQYIKLITKELQNRGGNIPEYKPLSIAVKSTCKTDKAVSNRVKILNLLKEDVEDEEVKKIINNANNKFVTVPNETMKKLAKDNNINVRIKKDEITGVIINN